jgi:hypothetical protein
MHRIRDHRAPMGPGRLPVEGIAMKRQAMLATFAVLVGAATVSCGDQPTAPSVDPSARTAPADASAQVIPRQRNGIAKHADERAALLTSVPVTGTLSDGGTFVGTFTATHLSIDETTRALSMTGTLTGTATTADGTLATVTQQFTAPMNLARSSSQSGIFHTTSAMATCDILFLDLGPLNLDLLGLTLDLSEIILDLNAVSGAGNLLGNLLCAVTGLLDAFGLLASISQLLDTINNILSGLSAGGATGVGLTVPGLLAPAAAFVIRS